ncbi:MAG: siphovirus ReqiPepy6 Gp37-like family protein [Oscillospiraceae bacterium]|nr:siphovirus ReqiPepy6 Gp37-like family protein [Oscillospiraceae bacterium]
MNLYIWKHVSEKKFQKIAVIDYAISVIWVRRFQDAGEFEVYLLASKALLELFTDGFLLITKEDDTENAMKPESIQLTTDSEEGNHLIVKGRSAECILSQRIIMPQMTFTSIRADEAVYYLVTYNAIAPDKGSETLREMRKIPELSIGSWLVEETKINIQYDGENLLEAVKNICTSVNMGFKVIFSSTGFAFWLYKGTDKTVNQTENTPVIFSPDFDNLGSTEYLYDMSTYYNLIQEGGEGEGSERKHVTVIESSEIKGLYLREKYVQAESISSNTEDGTLDSGTYNRILKQRAEENLRKAKETKEFSGEILNTDMYQFGVDYNLGDKVSIINEYGIQGTAVVSEITEVDDAEGYRLIPTFSDWKVN